MGLWLDSWRRFLRRPGEEQRALVEALFCLLIARLSVVFFPFRWLARWCGEEGRESPASLESEAGLAVLEWALATAGRYGWWDCRCLTQALAATAMLRRRGLPSTLYLGVVNPGPTDFRAHAWVRCGQRILTGRRGHLQFSVVARFARATQVGPVG